MYIMSLYFQHGYNTVQINKQTSDIWLEKASKSNEPLAMPVENKKTIKKSAESGGVLEQYALADLYLNGAMDDEEEKGINKILNKIKKSDEVSQNNKKFLKWLTKSAENGYAEAQYILGNCYLNSIGVEQDRTKAFKWYEKSAENGNAEGLGVAQDDDKAIELVSNSHSPYEEAYLIGLFYEEGDYIEQDYLKALKWYKKSSERLQFGRKQASSDLF